MSQKPLVICITGGMGTGKSTLARIFSEEFGIPVYMADTRAKELMHKPEIRKEIEKIFGPESFLDGKLNRAFLAKIVFNDKNQLRKLEKIVHPRVRQDFLEWKKLHKHKPFVALENAILFESGMDKVCDQIILVQAPLNIRIERVKNRDGLSEEEIMARIEKQNITAINLKNVNFFINNTNSENELLKEAKKIIAILNNLEK